MNGYIDSCEECGIALTSRNQQEAAKDAPYADGKFLCAKCRAEYMDLHHPDPFGDDMIPEVAWA